MYYALQIGCFLLAFSPPLALSYIVLGPRPVLVALAIIAAGFWVLSALSTGLAWSFLGGRPAAPSLLRASLVGTVLQECARAAVVVSYRRMEATLSRRKLFPLNDLSSSLACGVGFGAMHSLVFYGSVLAASLNPNAALFASSCSRVPLIAVSGSCAVAALAVFRIPTFLFLKFRLFASSAVTALLFFLLDVVLMVLAFRHAQHGVAPTAAVVLSAHLLASLTTSLNQMPEGCAVALPALLAAVGASSWAVRAMVR